MTENPNQGPEWLSEKDFESLVNFHPVDLREPSAWLGHIPFAYWIIEKIRPDVLVELGTHYGASYFAFCQSIATHKTGTKAFAVDTWQGDKHAGFYGENVFQSVSDANNVYKSFSTLLRASFDEASASFGNKSIDLLHIDGLHTYESVKHDFETWLPKLTENAVVLLHDTNVHRDDFGVHRFWSEISDKYPSMEFFHYNGLGVIQICEPDSSFIPTDEETKQIYRNIFEAISDSMLVKFERDRLILDLNNLIFERDAVIAENKAILNTKIFTWTKPLRDWVFRLRQLLGSGPT
jgi:hypothetical protein